MCDQIGTIHSSKKFGHSTMKLYELRVQPIGTSTRMRDMCKVQICNLHQTNEGQKENSMSFICKEMEILEIVEYTLQWSMWSMRIC
jgi:hypothetical protein